jgi:hypothetical protein
VADDVAVGFLALLLGTGQLGGTHEQNRLDCGTSHDVDEVVNADFHGLKNNQSSDACRGQW